MRNVVMKYCMNLICESKDYDENKLAIIQYGLEGIYITITKTIIIFFIAFLLGILKELFIFMIFYSIIRMPSFGLHATKSRICLFSSMIIFFGMTYFSKIVIIPLSIKCSLGILTIVFMFKNAPADTEKRPIVSKIRRERYKFISTCLAIIMVFFSIIIKEQFIANALLFSLIIQNFMISPSVYRLFHLPYDNYKVYLAKHSLQV